MFGANNKPLRYLLQAINYSAFMALIWFFSSAPSIRLLGEDEAVLTMAFSHAGQLREACRTIGAEELAQLPANMRNPEECPRERSPITIEVLMDGQLVFNKSFLPPGIYKDGSVNIYFSNKIPSGSYNFEIKMDDSVRNEGFEHIFSQNMSLVTAQILLIDFETEKGFTVN